MNRLVLLSLGFLSLIGECGKNPTYPDDGIDFSIPIAELPSDISPDGTHVLFTRHRTRNWPAGVFLLDMRDGSEQFLMPYDLARQEPIHLRFSPDGQQIALVRQSGLYVYDLQTGAQNRVAAYATEPEWDTSGTRIVYKSLARSSPSPDSALGNYIVDLATLEIRHVWYAGRIIGGHNLNWTQPGVILCDRLVPMGADTAIGTTYHIFSFSPEGEFLRDLTRSDFRNNLNPVYIDGGQRIMYQSYDPHSFNISETRVMNLDGSGAARWPVNLRPWRGSTAVSRDGTFFVFVSPDSNGQWGVLHTQNIHDFNGTTRRQLTVYEPPEDSADNVFNAFSEPPY